MHALTVDDEPLARAELMRLVRETRPEMEFAEAGSVEEALSQILRRRPEVVFLDLGLPGSGGLEMLPDLTEQEIPVIVVTAHEEHALEAVEGGVTDYLLKPIDPARMDKALGRLPKRISDGTGVLLLGDQTRYWRIRPQEIVRIKAEGSYTRVIQEGKQDILVSQALKDLEQNLQAHGFFRANRSELINLEKVEFFQRRSSGRIVAELECGEAVEFSRRQTKAFRDEHLDGSSE